MTAGKERPRYAILYLLGNSDLYLYDEQGREYVRAPADFREATRRLAEQGLEKPGRQPGAVALTAPVEVDTNDGAVTAARVDFRMFDALWKALELPAGEETYVNVWLFATDQTSKHPQDTCHLAAMLSKYARALLTNNGFHCDVSIRSISENPADYDAMARYFEKELSGGGKLQGYRTICGQISAGTPAMVMAFGGQLARRNARLFYLSKQGKSSVVKESSHFQHRFLDEARQDVLLAVDGLAYDLARGLVSRSPYAGIPGLDELLEAGSCMVNFEFGRLQQLAVNAVVARVWPEGRALTGAGQARFALGADLALRMQDCGRQMEALVLLAGLSDTILNDLAAELVPATRTAKRAEQLVRAIEAAKPEVGKRVARKVGIDMSKPARAVKRMLIEEIAATAPPRTPLRKFIEFYKDVEDLIEVRNYTPFAHGTRGVAREHTQRIDRALAGLKRYLGAETEGNLFNKHKKAVTELMDSETM